MQWLKYARFSLLGLLAACQTTSPFDSLPAEENAPRAEAITDEHSFRVWFAYYYINKDHQLLPDAVRYMSKRGYLRNHPEVATVFLAEIFRANPEKLTGWLAAIPDSDEAAWKVILASLIISGTDEAKALVNGHLHRAPVASRADIRKLTEVPSSEFRLVDAEITHPHHINLLWAAFSATGDPEYVKKVIGAIHRYESVTDPHEAEIGEVAIITLATNAMQHERVARICLDAHEDHPNDRTRFLLNAMLTAVAQILEEEAAAERVAH